VQNSARKKKLLNIIYHILTVGIALVWLLNGLFCKVLSFVPRHTEIVAHFFGEPFKRPLTILIGCSEIFMAIWFLSKKRFRFNIYSQIVIVLAMNILEFSFVPNLLLWGKFNLLFALLFVAIVYCYGQVLYPALKTFKDELA